MFGAPSRLRAPAPAPLFAGSPVPQASGSPARYLASGNAYLELQARVQATLSAPRTDAPPPAALPWEALPTGPLRAQLEAALPRAKPLTAQPPSCVMELDGLVGKKRQFGRYLINMFTSVKLRWWCGRCASGSWATAAAAAVALLHQAHFLFLAPRVARGFRGRGGDPSGAGAHARHQSFFAQLPRP